MSLSAEAFLLDGLTPSRVTSSSERCVVSGAVYGTAGAHVFAQLAVPPKAYAAASVPATETSTTTGADGSWSLTLARGYQYRIRIPSAGIDELFTVPDAASYTLLT